MEFSRDSYGYSWLLSRRDPGDLPALVSDLHAVNTALQDSASARNSCAPWSPSTTPSCAPSRWSTSTSATFYPFAPLPGQKRDNPLELQVKPWKARLTST
ncbi:PspA-associated protein PspAB [Streptomyces turgidiscabies]|uniref:Uncharacterized protein n=1 Tax=Streptomyces turgidiscabies TaxID=85558 RepID=A0ABU0RNP2_9ACTN|nr:hypothetical protein [Streptomyces turgidiscabies]